MDIFHQTVSLTRLKSIPCHSSILAASNGYSRFTDNEDYYIENWRTKFTLSDFQSFCCVIFINTAHFPGSWLLLIAYEQLNSCVDENMSCLWLNVWPNFLNSQLYENFHCYVTAGTVFHCRHCTASVDARIPVSTLMNILPNKVFDHPLTILLLSHVATME